MDDIQKTRISELRTEGYSCKRIAQELGLSENTVKSFCRRNKTMDGTVEKPKATAEHCVPSVRSSGHADGGTQRKEVLLGQMPEQVVEQPPFGGKAQGDV